MPSPLPIVAWECGDCTATNEGSVVGPCVRCHADNPRRYEILAGSAPAATARTTFVDRVEQEKIVRSATNFHRVAVIARPLPDRALLQRLQGTMVDIVGIEIGDRGRSCHAHAACGEQLVPGSKVRFRKEVMISIADGAEEVVIAAYIVGDAMITCKVGFLPRHLAIVRADDYDGMYARVIEVYSPRSLNITKRQKRHRNHGCCVAKILGTQPVFSL